MKCVRCHSMMFSETYDDHQGTSGQRISAMHCVMCGDIVDQVILKHRHETVEPFGNRARLAIVTPC